MISVIMPVYNKEMYVVDSLKSVINQTYRDFELIVVLDPSTDKSSEQVYNFLQCNSHDLKVKVVSRDEAGPGGYAARNRGIEIAENEYVTFIDADDTWSIDHLENLHLAAKNNPNASFFSSEWLNTVGKEPYTVFNISEFLSFEVRQRRRLALTSAVMVRRSLIVSIGGFPDGAICQGGDVNLWLRLCLYGKYLIKLNKKTVCYRVDVPQQVSASTINDPAFQYFTAKSILSDQENDVDKFLLMKWSNQLVFYAWANNCRISLRAINYFNLSKIVFYRVLEPKNIVALTLWLLFSWIRLDKIKNK